MLRAVLIDDTHPILAFCRTAGQEYLFIIRDPKRKIRLYIGSGRTLCEQHVQSSVDHASTGSLLVRSLRGICYDQPIGGRATWHDLPVTPLNPHDYEFAFVGNTVQIAERLAA